MTDEAEELPKPRELLAARVAAEELFDTLRDWFDVPDEVTIDLRAVDSAVSELSDPQYVMAMAMRKLQALHLLTTPGVVTTTDVVLTVIQDLERALLQAPSMHLRNAAAETDWDAALAELDEDPIDPAGGHDGEGGEGEGEPAEAGAAGDRIEAFRRHHSALHEAARAVLRASDGEIRRLI
ncbi:hypothetical protein ER308_00815 [Egibacter rhizosphaerae]|uniref:Uncharacterized protein n=1 Tax=Egibacter rhizosphaerae TaxID=1670831 RepID=A0A411YAM0_9ACTN|nr:hypothetical protein [Egibacter rhizosphaerae]QBI18254.1 hypothetical protein ER308_00815 [Egibacter rhizosphaerae]